MEIPSRVAVEKPFPCLGNISLHSGAELGNKNDVAQK